MNELIIQGGGALAVSERDRIRIAAAWEALSVNSRRSYQGALDRCGEWLADRGISLDDLSDELMAVYIATLDAEGRTPATISVSGVAVKWFFPMCGTKIGTGRRRRTSCGRFAGTQRRGDPDRSHP